VHQFIDKRNFEAVLLGWSLGRDPDQYSIWNSEQTEEGRYNFVSYKNAEVDRLLNEGRRSFDQKKREVIYHKIHGILADDLPYIFLYYPESLPCVHKRIKAVEATPAGIGWNFNKWWVPRNQQKYTMVNN
jgi:peptide/nickel transport system substrate-binding protein